MKMDRINGFIKSILAGIMISIGGMVFLSSENKVVGGLLFSTGLVSVVLLGFYLFTGRIGYVLSGSKTENIDTALSLIGNLVGCIIVGLIYSPVGNVVKMCGTKLDKSLPRALIDGVFCGLLIYICVEIYKKHKKLIGIFLCIPTFILCGFEHCVADMFYMINARIFSVDSVLFVVMVAIGNTIGGLLVPALALLSDRTGSKS